MHILYHLPSEYDNINNQYMKDLDDKKEIELEDLHADLRHKYDRLLDQGNIENPMTTLMTKLLKKKKP